MKKFISLTIILTMLLSVFYCFPAEARVYEDYPYIYLDFEENNLDQLKANNEVGTNLTSRWTAGGANGTNGCISLDDKGAWANNYYYFKEPLKVGQTYRASVWMKVTTENLLGIKPRVSFIFYTATLAGNKSAVKTATLSGTFVAGEWVHYTGTIAWDGMAENESNSYKPEPLNPEAPMHVAVRVIGTGSATLWSELKTKKEYENDETFTVHYDMDDIIVEPDVGAEKPTYDDSYVVALDFEDGTTGGVGGGGTKKVVDDPERGKVLENVAKIDMFNEVIKTATMEYNHLYKVSFWVKRTDEFCDYGGQNSRAQFINWLQNRLDKENITKGSSYPAYFGPNDIKQGEWKYVEFYQKYDVKTFDNKKIDVGIRIGNNKASQYLQSTNPPAEGAIEEGEEGVTCYIDDFFIQDMGHVQNGDFEAGISQIWRYTAERDGKLVKPNVMGWFDENAASSISTDVRSTEADPKSKSTQSMSVNITSNGGRVYQGINFENGKEYKLTFWAKGLDMAAGEEKPLSALLDRKVETVGAQDVYEVEDYETLVGKDWKLTNEWKKYEYTFKPNYESKSAPAANVIPRTPFLYFDVDGNKAGTKFLVDDITFEDANAIIVDPEVSPYPRLESVELVEGNAVSGGTVQVDYEFVSEVEGMMEGESVVRALISEDGTNWGCIGQSATFGRVLYTIPDIAIGKQLKLEIAPMDEVYQMGEITTVELGEVKKAFEIIPEITKWDKETGEVAASVFIENNLSSLGNQEIVVILALYDENNTLVSTTVKPEIITEQYSETIKVSAVSNASATKARLYVWSGTSLADAGEKSYCEAVSLNKNAEG